jgi:hypothetical protein
MGTLLAINDHIETFNEQYPLAVELFHQQLDDLKHKYFD